MRKLTGLTAVLSLLAVGQAYAQTAPVYEAGGEISPAYQGGAIELYQPATPANQITRVVEPVRPIVNTANRVPASYAQGGVVIQAPITYTEAGVVKAQHYKRSDLSDAQYQALMEEAARVRAYRQSLQGAGIYDTNAPATVSNNYEMNLYAPGDVPVVRQPTSPDVRSEPTITAHKVKKGDTLYNISKRYAVTVAQIQDANGIFNTSISLGQTLVIPSATIPAQSLNTSIAQPIFASAPVQSGNVTRRVVQPAAISTTPSNYAVLKSDTIYGISRRTCLSPADLIQVNNLENPNKLMPGQMLKLPKGHCLTK